MKLFHHHPGVSLLIATIFAAAMMLMTANLVEVQWKAGQMRRSWDISGRVFYIGESVKAIAKAWAGGHGYGMNTLDVDLSKDPFLPYVYAHAKDVNPSLCSDGSKCLGFTVYGRSPSPLLKLNGVPYYSVPLAYQDETGKLRHTGDAAEECEASPDPGFTADDPCHWNKIGLGEAVEVPLYYEDSTGEPIKPLLGSLLKVRVRAPLCKEGEFGPSCDSHGRIILYPTTHNTTAFADIENDRVLIQWLLLDKDRNDAVLLANDSENSDQRFKNKRLLPPPEETQNTEISGGRINDANPFHNNVLSLTDFTVLEEKLKGEDLERTPTFIKDFLADPNVKRPSLRLEMIGRPQKDDGTRQVYGRTKLDDKSLFVPYLEWQVLASKPISDSKSYYSGWVDLQGFGRRVSGIKKRPVSPQSFVLSQP